MTLPFESALPEWLRTSPELADLWLETYFAEGDGASALTAVQGHPSYDIIFAGNRREDGSLRYSETLYMNLVESFDMSIRAYGMKPEVFRSSYGDLISGDVAPSDFGQRLDTLYERIFDSSDGIRQWYTDNAGIAMTNEAIMASFMSEDVATRILNKEITMAEIGGEGYDRGFNVASDLANRMFEAGMDERSEAASFFASAEGILPILNTLAKRHADPDDDFSLEDFTQAQVFGDPEQRRRIRLLQAQERSTFAEGTGQGQLIRRNREGLNVGLIQR